MLKKFAFLFFAFTVVLSACRKDSDITTIDTSGNSGGGVIPPSVIVTGNLIGTITDEFDNPVEAALVRLKSNSTLTDENGIFNFSNVQMEEDGVLITADKSGFFKAYDRIRATANQTSYTKIQLLDRSIVGSFPAGAATDITFDGATVKFQSNGFVDANGNDYNGTVNVAAHWIDPTSNDLDEQMPGDLRAVDMEEQYSVLKSFGMVAVDLIADNGTDVQLKEGVSAEINFPIPNEILNNAPASIPLWSFDEELGYWIEEGSATKVGNMYVGNVTHFSFWNCDAPFPLIEMEGQIVDQNGNGIDGAYVCIDFADDSQYGSGGYANEEGFFGGKIPKDELLTLSIKDPCWNEIFSTEIGPFSENVNLGQIQAAEIENYLFSLNGVLECNDEPVTNGYAIITVDSTSSFPVYVEEDGSWEKTILLCNNTGTFEVFGYDLESILVSEPVLIDFEAGINIFNVGTIQTCEEPTEILTFNAGDENNVFFEPFLNTEELSGDTIRVFFNGGFVSASADSLSTFNMIWTTSSTEIGTYTEEIVVNYDGFDPNIGNEFSYSTAMCADCEVTIEITKFEEVGGFVEGTYFGTILDQFSQGDIVPLEGEFRIIRD